MPICSCCKTGLVARCDLFGHQVKINVDRDHRNHRTFAGGIISLIYIAGIMYILVQFTGQSAKNLKFPDSWVGFAKEELHKAKEEEQKLVAKAKAAEEKLKKDADKLKNDADKEADKIKGDDKKNNTRRLLAGENQVTT